MAGSFRIAEGFVEVTADETGYDRAIDRLKAKKTTVKIGVNLDDKDAKAKLSTLLKARTVRVGINLADKAATTSLRNLAKTRTVKLTAKLDARAATTALDKLSRDRTVQLTARFDDTAASRKLAALSEQHTVGIAPSISDAAYNRVKAQLDKLAADRVVNIRASVDTRVGAAEIRNLIQRRQVRIGIDVDTRVAADSLANLTRRRNMTVGVNLNSTDARARLDTLTRDRHINVRADVDRSAASRISGMFSGLSSGALSAAKASITNLAVVALEAVPTLASLGQALIQMGPAAALAAPAVLSLGAAFAAIKVGTSGIGDAFKAAFAPAVKSASQAESATRRVESAQRSLAKAQQAVKDAEVNAAEARVKAARDIADAQQSLKNTVSDVADANRRAAESVAGAERDLADAQRAARQAQEDLTDARKQAAQDLEDLNNRLADAQLDQRQKVLDLEDAEKNLAAVKAKGSAASAEEIAKAQLEYDQALQALKEQQTETARLQQETKDANTAGVEGSKTVKDAKQKESDAQQEIIDKTQALKDAQIEAAREQQDGAQRILKAQRDVADAQAAAAKAASDGARQIADAQESAKEAAEALAQAQESVGLSTNKVADALARLSPNARAFVQAVIAQRAAWRGLKLSVQDKLFAGLGQKFTTMSRAILPSLKSGLTGTAGVLNTMARNAMDAVTNLGRTGTLKKLFAGMNGALKPLSKVPGQFVTGLAQIGVAAAPAFKRVTSAAGGFFDRISKQIDQASKNGHLEKVIDQALKIASQFGKLIGNIFGTLGNVFKAASKGGGDVLGGLSDVFKELRRITAMPEVQKALTSIFKALADVGKMLAGVVGKALQAVLPLLAQLAPFVSQLAEKLGPVVGQLLETFGKALGPILTALMPILNDVANLVLDLVQSLTPLLKPLGDLIAVVLKAVAPVITAFADQLAPLVSSLVQGLLPVIKALVPIVGQFGVFLGQLAPLFPQMMTAVLPLIPPLSQLAVSLLRLAMQVIQPLLPLIVKLAQFLTTILTGAITTLVPAITMVIGWLTKFVDAVTGVVKWIVDKFTWLYDKLVGHSIIPDLVNAIITWFTSLWTKTKQIFTTLKDWVVNTWNALWNGVRTKWDSFWTGLKNALSGAWSWAKSSVSGLKTSITNTWHALWNDASSKVSSVFSSIKGKISGFVSNMKSAFSHLRDALGSIWNGIESKISGPVKWVISHVYNSGIRSMWNTIAGKISSKLTLPYISLGFSEGGVVPGKPTNKDTVPAMLAPGERVLSNAQVAQLGGQRAIDAMLGQDHPTRTGGNPTQKQERRREQAGVQHFSLGGIVDSITGAIGSATSWAKGLVIGGLKAAAEKAISSLIRPLINRIPGGGVGSLMRGMSNKALDGMLGFLGGEDKKAVGGPAVQRALAWAKSQSGLPYQWAGNGNPSWDCATLESVITTPRGPRKLADVEAGDTVTAFQDGKLVSSRVLAKWCTGEQEVYKVRTRNRELRVTPGHRVLAAVQQSSIPGVRATVFDSWTTQWKHVRDLTCDDFLVTYTGHNTSDGDDYPTDLAWLLGLWVADGSAQAGGGLRFCVYGDLADKVQEVWRKYYPDRKATHNARHGVMINHKGFVDWMTEVGFRGKSHERIVPPIVSTWNRAAQDAFLEGYADGDGSYRGSGRKQIGDFHLATEVIYTATSRELMEGIRAMHIQRGDRASVLRTHNRGSKPIIIGGAEVKNVRPVYRFEAALGKGADQSTGAGHRPGLLQLVKQLKTENMSVQKVLSVEPDGVEKTWDIEVEDSHSFVSDGLISHNCSGFMSAIESVIRGERPHRRWATGSFPPGPSGWVRNLQSPFMIGITNAGVGHTAGTLAGVNFESSGGRGVHYGKTARGYNDPLFTSRWGFEPATKYDTGGLLQPGATMAVNATGRPERVLDADQTARLDALLTNASITGGGVTVHMTVNSLAMPTPAERKAWASGMAKDINEALRVWNKRRS